MQCLGAMNLDFPTKAVMYSIRLHFIYQVVKIFEARSYCKFFIILNKQSVVQLKFIIILISAFTSNANTSR